MEMDMETEPGAWSLYYSVIVVNINKLILNMASNTITSYTKTCKIQLFGTAPNNPVIGSGTG